MNPLSNHINCPVCYKNSPRKVFDCVDYSISQETFTIWQCEGCTLRFTHPVPEESAIGPYYQASHYISHSDSSEGLINKLYKMARRWTLSEKRRFVVRQTAKATGQLLDVGAGTGAFLHEMVQSGWDIVGLEPDNGARKKAFDLYKLSIFEPGYLFELSQNTLDVITLWHVLEHVYDLQGYMHHFSKLLKKNGMLFIAFPNYTGYDATHYKNYWAAYDVPRHLYHFSPKAIEELAAKHDFRIMRKKPMWLDAFYIAMLSEQYRHGRVRYISALWHGMISTVKTIMNPSMASSLIYVLKKK